jgi:multiple sugar transport system ATP-binding protein
MNLVDGELVRDDGPAVAFGSYKLGFPASLMSERPGLDTYIGKKVIVGIRPPNFEDASLVTDRQLPTMNVTAHITEELGSEVNVIFEIDAPPVEHADTAALARDVGEEEAEAVGVQAEHSLWTARVSPRTRVRPGDQIELAVDTSSLHFFDPDTGLAIGRQRTGAPLAGAGAGAAGTAGAGADAVQPAS